MITFFEAFFKGILGSTEDNNSPEGATGQYILLSLQVCTLKKQLQLGTCILYLWGERSYMLCLTVQKP